MSIPAHLRYTAEHEWLEQNDDHATVGITAYAVEALGDIVYVQLPEVGDRIEAGQPCGELESTKSVSDLFAPATGEVLEVNQHAADKPEILKDDPYGAAWLFRMRVEGEPATLSAAEYAALTGSEG